MDTIRLGISSCLLGEKVRYDGGHKLNRYLRDILGPFVEYVPVCPEAECGLSIPRESMHLEGDPEAPRLVTTRSKKDLTDRMTTWARGRIKELAAEDLCGFIFKSRSPSSGMSRVKIYDSEGIPRKTGSGVFAGMFMKRFPLLPVEDEGRLNDAGLRENFIERIFVYRRWQEMTGTGRRLGPLVQFHAEHKLILMSHSPKHLRELGKLVAAGKGMPASELFSRYRQILMEAVMLKATVNKNTNVLMHIMGYFKRDISSDEKQELLEVIGHYHKGLVPLIVPVTLANHYVRRLDESYLKMQHYLHPHPIELRLRNHV